MPIDTWLNRETPSLKQTASIYDFPGYTYAWLSCPICDEQFRALYNGTPDTLRCPGCKESKLTVLSIIRKIYAQ
jgi:hypothetical protein